MPLVELKKKKNFVFPCASNEEFPRKHNTKKTGNF